MTLLAYALAGGCGYLASSAIRATLSVRGRLPRRLRFIRALKDLQDQGQCGTITLRDMHRLIAALDVATLQGLLERGPPAAEVGQLLAGTPPPPVALATLPAPMPAAPAVPAPPAAAPATPSRPVTGPSGDRRSYGLADAGIRQRFAGAGAAPRPPAPAAPPPDATQPLQAAPPRPPTPAPEPAAEVAGTLGDLLRELEVRPGLAGRRLAPGASEHWTEIPITSRVFLSVRGLSTDDAPLADAAARELKKLLRVR
jgi:hypothetical protein